jgi:hypothetical protein
MTSPPPDLVPVRLVPVEVFGTEDCCQHGDNVDHDNRQCTSIGYGIMDAVSAWSDCNRAIGRIYRAEDRLGVDDAVDPYAPGDDPYRTPGETLVVWVPRDQVDWFKRRWNTSAEVTRDHVRGETLPVGNPE